MWIVTKQANLMQRKTSEEVDGDAVGVGKKWPFTGHLSELDIWCPAFFASHLASIFEDAKKINSGTTLKKKKAWHNRLLGAYRGSK